MIADKKAAEEKYKAEFNSGKPYKPKKKDEKDDKEAQDPMDVFEGQTGVTISLMCRLIFETDNEKLIFATGSSVLAHLEKLEKDGKVVRVTVNMPKIVDGDVGEVEAQEGWQIVEKKEE